MKHIGVVTGARSDYGIYLPLLRAIQSQPDLQVHLFVTGMHLAPEFGYTVLNIEQDGFEIADRIDMLSSADTPTGTAQSMGRGLAGFAQAFHAFRPDLLIVLGDRFEMLAAVMAAVPFSIPIAHIAGGVVTVGAIDDTFRHAITKAAHIHFAETKEYARRIIQMGEEPWRVHVTGALALDHLNTMPLMTTDELEQQFKIPLSEPPLLVTFHPVTRTPGQAETHVAELLAALETIGLPVVFTYPNADAGGRAIIRKIDAFASSHAHVTVIPNLGTRAYFSLMSMAAAMVGNSSSGLVEAPSFKLPVVNIGDRQKGRIAAANVITVDCNRIAIADGILKATDAGFRRTLTRLVNPYGDGHTAERMLRVIQSLNPDERLIKKEFYDIGPDTVIPECGTP